MEVTVMVVYCTLHRIGYNDELDPVCPQCSLGHIMPPEQLPVDMNPSSPGYGRPIRRGEEIGDMELRKVLGR